MSEGYEFIVIDAYCRKGGAAMGYRRAGAYVVGNDREPEHKDAYAGHEFYAGDAIAFLRSKYVKTVVEDALAVGTPILAHTSPPCQEGNTQTNGTNKGRAHTHQQLVPATREALEDLGIPYVIEQPTSSRKDLIRRDVTLCMDMFNGDNPPPWVQRHRSFELGGWSVTPIPHPKGPVSGHQGYTAGYRHGVYTPWHPVTAPYVQAYGKGGGKATVEQMQHAMGLPWITDHFDLREAIPPAYTQWLGERFLSR
jgi:hypothetical protein